MKAQENLQRIQFEKDNFLPPGSHGLSETNRSSQNCNIVCTILQYKIAIQYYLRILSQRRLWGPWTCRICVMILISSPIIKLVHIYQSTWNNQHVAQCLAQSEKVVIFVARINFSLHLFHSYYVHVNILSDFMYINRFYFYNILMQLFPFYD